METCGREFLGRRKFPSPSWEFTSALWEAELSGACLALVEPHLTGAWQSLFRLAMVHQTPPRNC